MIHQNGETKENEYVFCNIYFIWKGSLEVTKKLLIKTKDSAPPRPQCHIIFPISLISIYLLAWLCVLSLFSHV